MNPTYANELTKSPTPEAKPCSEIESQMNAIWSSLDELQYSIIMLTDKLNTCLIVVPENPQVSNGVKDHVCSSPLGQSLECVNNHLLAKIYAIRYLTERVAL